PLQAIRHHPPPSLERPQPIRLQPHHTPDAKRRVAHGDNLLAYPSSTWRRVTSWSAATSPSVRLTMRTLLIRLPSMSSTIRRAPSLVIWSPFSGTRPSLA